MEAKQIGRGRCAKEIGESRRPCGSVLTDLGAVVARVDDAVGQAEAAWDSRIDEGVIVGVDLPEEILEEDFPHLRDVAGSRGVDPLRVGRVHANWLK